MPAMILSCLVQRFRVGARNDTKQGWGWQNRPQWHITPEFT